MLRFSDGVNIDTSGELRVLRLRDGYYVVGEGMCFPENSREDAEKTIRSMKERKEKGKTCTCVHVYEVDAGLTNSEEQKG